MLIVAPERDTPGTTARACARPSVSACRSVSDSIGLSLAPTRSAMPRTTPSTTSVVAMIHSERKSFSITSLRATPAATMGSVPTMTYQPIRASDGSQPRRRDLPAAGRNLQRPDVRPHGPLVEQRPGPRVENPPDVLREVEDHRGLGADLDDGRECGTGVVPPHELGDDPQMRTGRNGQELGQTLKHAEHDRLEPLHHGEPPASPAASTAATRALSSPTRSSTPPWWTATDSVVTPDSAYACRRSRTRSNGPIRAVLSTNSKGTAAAASRCLRSRKRAWTTSAACA